MVADLGSSEDSDDHLVESELPEKQLNGSFSQTLFVCAAEDIYINFPCATLLRKDTDFRHAIECAKSNLVFDSRLELTILYNSLYNSDEVLVYDIHKQKIYSLHMFLSEKYSVKPYANVQTFAFCFLVLNYYYSFLRFNCKSFTGDNIIDVLLDTIGPQHLAECDTDNVNSVIKFFNTNILLETPKIEKVNRYEFYVALTLLNNINWCFNI
jgi:hypothetical protein